MAFVVPAVMTALSAAGTAYTQVSASNKANAAEVAGIEQQQQTRQQAAGAVNREVQNISASNPAALKAQSSADFTSNLRANEAATNPLLSGASTVPGSNKKYQANTAIDSTNVSDFADNLVNNMAGMNAAVKQRQQEQLSMGTLQTNLGLFGQQSGANSFITQLRAAQAGQINPYEGSAASALGGLAQGVSKNPGGYGLTNPYDPTLDPGSLTAINTPIPAASPAFGGGGGP